MFSCFILVRKKIEERKMQLLHFCASFLLYCYMHVKSCIVVSRELNYLLLGVKCTTLFNFLINPLYFFYCVTFQAKKLSSSSVCYTIVL